MIASQLEDLGIDPSWYDPIMDAFKRYNISTTNRQAHFLGQCMHESRDFKVLQEDLHYSARALMATWPSRFPDMDTAEKYENNPEKIANKVYAGRNGNNQEGDGYKYRGRGVIQLTGKELYENCGKSLGIDLISNPDYLLDKKYAALSAGWYWNKKGLNDLADAGDIETITKRINGGLNGLESRKINVAKAQAVLDTY